MKDFAQARVGGFISGVGLATFAIYQNGSALFIGIPLYLIGRLLADDESIC